MPRETFVDVAKELGTELSVFFKPPCVSVHRLVSHQTRTLITKHDAMTLSLSRKNISDMKDMERNTETVSNVTTL